MARELMHQRVLIMVWLGEAALALGRLSESAGMADQALRMARDNDERGHEAWALHLLGEIRARSGPLDLERSAECYRQARARAETLGMRPVIARAFLGLGSLESAATSRDHGREHLERARAMLHEMGMELWLATARCPSR
jgi:ATP/maltotriose-dependent transcriptional regulator MalT